ncbi:MAG: transposase [Deltaproteobacteria bacterium]|nr:transposase [Deltaproteobacteria bacterium]
MAAGMGKPRQVLPGKTYMVSRRCLLRMFLLRPSKKVNEVFLYCLAAAAERFGVAVHSFCVMSNHYHLVITDQRGELPLFMHLLNQLTSRAINSLLGRFESFWAQGTYSAVELPDDDAIIDKIAYTLANPVSAGLVQTGRSWPGLRNLPEDVGSRVLVVQRPLQFFRKDGALPAEIALEIALPPFEDLSGEDARSCIAAAVEAQEDAARSRIAAEGRKFLGRRAIRDQSSFDRPDSRESRFRINPRTAGRDKWKRIETLSRLRSFLEAYREAKAAYLSGHTGAVFPAGTWLMRVRYGVACADTG